MLQLAALQRPVSGLLSQLAARKRGEKGEVPRNARLRLGGSPGRVASAPSARVPVSARSWQCTPIMQTNVKAFEMFTDASGAPALIQAGPCTWSLNCLGEVTYHAQGGQSGTPRALRAASARVAVAAYESMLGAEWRDRNREMYADLAVSA